MPWLWLVVTKVLHAPAHCVKSVQIRRFLWFVFSSIRTEYGHLLRKSPLNTGKYGLEKTPYLEIFTQWQSIIFKLYYPINANTEQHNRLTNKNSKSKVKYRKRYILNQEKSKLSGNHKTNLQIYIKRLLCYKNIRQ